MKYEKANAEITFFDESVIFMTSSTGSCAPVGDTTVVCTGGFSCEEITAGGNHKFYCTGYDSSKYNATTVGSSGKWECDPVTCISY